MCKWILRLAVAMLCLMVSMPVFAASRSIIREGWYKIVPLHAQNKSLDVNGAGREAGTNLQLWTYGDAPQQKFYVQHRGNGWYSFKAGHCDLYVDAQGGSPTAGENVWLYPWNGSDAQLWGLYAAGDGGYYIETKMQSGLVFDCAGGGAHDGNNVQLWPKDNVNWHKWKFVPVSIDKSRSTIPEGWYKIVPLHAQNKSLDVNGAGRNAGTNLQLWTYGDAPQQKFYVKHRGNGWYSFKAGHCDLYVDAQGGSPAAGENVWLYPWNGSDAQLWGLYAAGDGGYYIETKMQSGLVFDCAGGGAHDGNNVQLWPKDNVNWHKWKFVPVSLNSIPLNTSEKYAVATSGTNLLLRSGPGTGYGIKARMPNGSTVDVYSINNGWADLSYNGTRGYASASYLRKLNEPIPVPIQDSEETKVVNRINQLYSTSGYRLNTRYTGSGQCRGFANKVYQTLFAVGYIGGYTNDNYGAATYPSSYSVGSIRNFAANDVNSVRNLFNKAKPGAFVQIGRRYKLNSSGSAAAPHSAIVVSVDSNGVTFYEANTDGKNTIKKNYYTWAQLADRNKGYTIYLPNTYRLK